MKLNKEQMDRAIGVMLGAACGDALGVPYEFAGRLQWDQTPTMKGGGLGPYEPGEWSDDTQMATVILEAATRTRLLSDKGLDAVATGFSKWRSGGASDVGAQTSSVISRTNQAVVEHVKALPAWRQKWFLTTLNRVPAGRIMSEAALTHHNRTGRSGGNGSLMRTAPVALAYLGDRRKCAEAARRVSAVTHYDPMAGDLCVLWCEAIRHAVFSGTYSVTDGLDLIRPERREGLRAIIREAGTGNISRFSPNGYVVPAFQVAVRSLLASAGGNTPESKFRDALYRAIRVGNDTDTTAAITGALAGATWGASAIPAEWRKLVNGWSPVGSLNASTLADMVREVVSRA